MSTQPDEAREQLQRRMVALYGQQVRRGERQLVVVKGMMERRTAGAAELDGALAAARRTAAFIARQGWIRGPVWLGYGPQWLLARWALDQGLSSADIAAHIEKVATQTTEASVEGASDETNDSKRRMSARRRRARSRKSTAAS